MASWLFSWSRPSLCPVFDWIVLSQLSYHEVCIAPSPRKGSVNPGSGSAGAKSNDSHGGVGENKIEVHPLRGFLIFEDQI